MLPWTGLISIATLLAGSPAVGSLVAEAPDPVEVVGGETVDVGRWDEVVGYLAGTGFCSGVVVTPQLVLTAAHCIDQVEPDQADEFAVAFGSSITDNSGVAQVEQFGAFPDFCSDCFYDRFDIGYLKLVQTVSLPGGFPSVITDQETWDETMNEGQALTLVGFGQAESGTPTADDLKGLGIKREIGATFLTHADSGLDFATEGDGGGTCQGDSGGPAMVTLSDGSFAVAGLLSGGFGECGTGSYFSVPLPALSWIREETGIDLLPAQCEDGECVDTALPDGGCGCSTQSHRGLGSTGLFVLLLLMRRPRHKTV